MRYVVGSKIMEVFDENAFDEELFSRFLRTDCDRARFILDFFYAHSLKAYIMPVCAKNHIYVSFERECYDSKSKIKTVLAHYDRAKNVQGANDNSFAVFVLMHWAVEMARLKKNHNVRLIFTDGEEAIGDNLNEFSVTAQGSYSLASLFKKLKITNDLVFVFDAMGRGTVPVLAKRCFSEKTHFSLPRSFCRKFSSLQNIALSILIASSENPKILPLPYSDNAGFIARGIPAAEITMLPCEEALLYENALVENPDLEDFVMNRRLPQNASSVEFEAQLPLSWRLFHGENDCQSSLTISESARVFKKILYTLSDFSFPIR